MCFICSDEAVGENLCEEAVKQGLFIDSCSLCYKKEKCPLYFIQFTIKSDETEVTIQVCSDCMVNEKNSRLIDKLTILEDEQTYPSGSTNTCPFHKDGK